MSKKLILHSGGQDSTSMMLEYITKHGPENIISLGFDYGQRHFECENAAASRFCVIHDIPRHILTIPLDQIGGCSLTDHTIDVTTDMAEQRSTVVPQRNAIFIIFAAAFAQENDCDTIVHGACVEDYAAYRDCRPLFFDLMETAIQAGRTDPIKGSEDITDDLFPELTRTIINRNNLDIKIDTPLIHETKIETLKRVAKKYGVEVFIDSYTCYNGVTPQCGKCPACIERQESFKVNGLIDPLPYAE